MPLRRSLLISALLHTMLLWGAFASSLPLKERIFLVEITEGPEAAAQSEAKKTLPETRGEPARTGTDRLTSAAAPQRQLTPAEPGTALPETLSRPLPKEAAMTGAVTAEDARLLSGVSAGPPAPSPPQSGGGPAAAHQGRPLAFSADGGAGNGETLLSQLRARIERSLVYPPLARKRKIEGGATVSFMVGEAGNPVELRLVRSSGHRLLDEEALSTVRRAVPLPRMTGRIEIPIRFRLSEEE